MNKKEQLKEKMRKEGWTAADVARMTGLKESYVKKMLKPSVNLHMPAWVTVLINK